MIRSCLISPAVAVRVLRVGPGPCHSRLARHQVSGHRVEPDFVEMNQQGLAGVKLGVLLGLAVALERRLPQGGAHTELGRVRGPLGRGELEGNARVELV